MSAGYGTRASQRSVQDADRVHDILGIGFGPSNLALAIAAMEHNATPGAPQVSVGFLEKQRTFGWHTGMLLDGATMQVSFLKDLATLRNPVSPFGFLSYLHAKGRLVDFINHKVLYPSRVEFHDYLRWCADQLDPLVDYGYEAVSARPVEEDGEVVRFEVVARDWHTGRLVERSGRNLVMAPGLRRRLPEGVVESKRVWHSADLLKRIEEFDGRTPRRFVVLGAGQSAAEVTHHLYHAFPSAEVCAVFSRYGYSQSDDSPLANRIFDPAAVDDFFGASEQAKADLQRYHSNTNYSVVDVDLIEELYRSWYLERVRNHNRLRLLNMTTLLDVADKGEEIEVTLRHAPTEATETLRADLLVCATGYSPADARPLLGDVRRLLWTDERGLPRVGRDYRIAADERVVGGIYLCGGTEHSHGITSSLLSNAAVRAGEILASVLDRAEGRPHRAETRPERPLTVPVASESAR
ncbi:L-lysine 6-monooxygenase [Actinomadura logoneensis]|uniref:L-lysine N6-monooxygenase MbtG n=1 Tax=Actinomadura logoneensis TaxID=2293572 RepID=A0A372J8P1_9ACTN|nr:SidA/IucD/PvdA family monooxygenase [Actinomadura logoneensis]RFU36347.1 L-lysine 6-monooxygenase [Actinomadura logoneensis]